MDRRGGRKGRESFAMVWANFPWAWSCYNREFIVIHDAIVAEVIALLRDKIGPVAAFKTAAVVAQLPKTRSGKILRSTMKTIADGAEWQVPATIDDPAVLDEIARALETVLLSRR